MGESREKEIGKRERERGLEWGRREGDMYGGESGRCINRRGERTNVPTLIEVP